MPANMSLNLQGLDRPLKLAAAHRDMTRSEFIRRAIKAAIEREAELSSAFRLLLESQP